MATLTKETLVEYFDFLDDLRESGVTNMFGAGPYLQEGFDGLKRNEAHHILGLWMKTFTSETVPLEDRAVAALKLESDNDKKAS